ncbi:MAG: type II toxin-antitoxin system RelE/ParE family toxin [Stellaceae bacterium]
MDDLRHFPADARREAGYQLDRVQRGIDPDDCRPLPSIGAGLREIRVRERAGPFRVIYVASYRLENDPRFLRRVEQSRKNLRAERSVRIEDLESAAFDGLCGVPDDDIKTFAHSPERSIDLLELGGMTKIKEAINLWTVPPEETAYRCLCHTPNTRFLVQLHLRRSQRRQGHATATTRWRWRRDILAPCDSSGQCFLYRIRSALKRVL